jgi:hypothetical protein
MSVVQSNPDLSSINSAIKIQQRNKYIIINPVPYFFPVYHASYKWDSSTSHAFRRPQLQRHLVLLDTPTTFTVSDADAFTNPYPTVIIMTPGRH